MSRKNSVMARIQISEVPEETYELLLRRARAAGQSLQQYMRQELIALARRQSKAESVAAVVEIRSRISRPVAVEGIVAALLEGRLEREAGTVEAEEDSGGLACP